MTKRVLITGGAGFIGSFLTDALIAKGYDVRVFDNLEDQVHHGKVPTYMNAGAEFVHGDVRDIDALGEALNGVSIVIHMAAAVGVAQSQYEIKRYADVNVGGTANLLDCIVNKKLPIKKILMPTSMTSYGEGAYLCADHERVRPGLRKEEDLARKDWQVHCPVCSAVVEPCAITETDERQSATIYSLTKNMQEDMLLNIAKTYGIPATAFRLFNVYGPRQSLSNPYTGVMAIFASRIKNNNPPTVFEDGLQSRDFISVHDVVRAFLMALETDKGDYEMFNVGSSTALAIRDVGTKVAISLGSSIEPVVTGEGRKNDIRHCFADTTKIRTTLGWEPTVSFEEGLSELVKWAEGETAEDRSEEANKILRDKKLYP